MAKRMWTAGIVALALMPACEGVEESSGAGATATAPHSFTVTFEPGTTAKNVIPQMVATGREHLALACRDQADAVIRIMNPLASGDYVDVACSWVLGDEATGEATAARVSGETDGPIGVAKQPWSPFGLGCTIATGLAYLFASRVLCDHPRAEQPRACRNVTDAGFFGLGVACVFL